MESDFTTPETFVPTLYDEILKRTRIEVRNTDAAAAIQTSDEMLHRILHSYITAHKRYEKVKVELHAAQGEDRGRLKTLLSGCIDENQAWRKSLILYLDQYYPSNSTKHLKMKTREVHLSAKASITLESLPDIARIVCERLISNLSHSDLEIHRPVMESGITGGSLRHLRDRAAGHQFSIIYEESGDAIEVKDVRIAPLENAGGVK